MLKAHKSLTTPEHTLLEVIENEITRWPGFTSDDHEERLLEIYRRRIKERVPA